MLLHLLALSVLCQAPPAGEPAEPVAASADALLFGKPIVVGRTAAGAPVVNDCKRAAEKITSGIFGQYAQRNKLAPTEAEVDELMQAMEWQGGNDGTRGIAKTTVAAWKLQKSLYDKYGGRVLFQQAGLEALGGMRTLLKDEERKGTFKVIEPAVAAELWAYFERDHPMSYYPKGENPFAKAWWQEKLEKQRPKAGSDRK